MAEDINQPNTGIAPDLSIVKVEIEICQVHPTLPIYPVEQEPGTSEESKHQISSAMDTPLLEVEIKMEHDTQLQSSEVQETGSISNEDTATVKIDSEDDYIQHEPISDKKIKNHKTETKSTNQKEKWYKCSECAYRTLRKYDLKRHGNLLHSGQKPYVCNLCSDRFTLKDHLLSHMKIHIGNKPYKCNVCSYRSMRSSDLKKHMTIHIGDKSFKCTLCDYKSVRKTCLMRHVKTHILKKLLQCNICDFTCDSSSEFSKHLNCHTIEILRL